LAFLNSTGISYRYNIVFAQGKERAMPGGDAEVGYDLTPHLTTYLGGYYFDHSDAPYIRGAKFRATYTLYRSAAHRLLYLFDRIRLEGLISNDSIRGTSWLFGLRFTFGLSTSTTHSNPTVGVMRHMTDPIRRDLNVVTEGFNDPTEFYLINGRRARVDLVSATSGQSIDDAVSGNADIIGVRGTHTADDVLILGDRDLTITGGRYDFVFKGHPYSISGVGENGSLTSAGSDSNLFTLEDASGSHNVTLEHLTMNSADDTGFALQTDGNTFGNVVVDYVTTDMPFDFALTTTDTSGQVTFTHNELDLQNSTAFDGNVDDFGGVIFYTDDDSQQLNILDFSDNTISLVSGRKINYL